MIRLINHIRIHFNEPYFQIQFVLRNVLLIFSDLLPWVIYVKNKGEQSNLSIHPCNLMFYFPIPDQAQHMVCGKPSSEEYLPRDHWQIFHIHP